MSQLYRTQLLVVSVLLIVLLVTACMVSFTPVRTQQNSQTSQPSME